MASMAVSIGVFALVVMLFVAGFALWQYYTVSSDNSNLRKTLNATQVDDAQLRAQVNSLQQQVSSLQTKVDQLEAAGGSERLNFSSAFVAVTSTGVWTVRLAGSNNGTAAATVNQIIVNGAPITEWWACTVNGCPFENITSLAIPTTSAFDIRFNLSAPAYSSGEMVDVRLVTTQSSYRVLLTLPGSNVQSESIYILKANATAMGSPVSGWTIRIAGQNTAPSPILFNQIQVNEVPIPATLNVTVDDNVTAPFVNASVPAGDMFSFEMNLTKAGFGGLTFSTGQTVTVTLVSTQGSYPLQVLLPASSDYEDLQISSGYAVASGSGNWAVVISGYNTGTAPATVQQILVNGQMAGSLGGAMVMSSLVNGNMVDYPGTVMPAGATFNYIITVFGVSAGQTIQVKIVTGQATYSVQVPTS